MQDFNYIFNLLVVVGYFIEKFICQFSYIIYHTSCENGIGLSVSSLLKSTSTDCGWKWDTR